MCKKTVRILQLINCRTLMRDQALSINQKLVLFGFATENWMVLKDETLEFRAGLPLKKQSRRQSANASANNDAVVELAAIDEIFWKRIVNGVSNRVPGLKHRQSISV